MVESFPIDCQSTPVEEDDPQYHEMGCYLCRRSAWSLGVFMAVAYDIGVNIEGIIWLRAIVDKLAFKHHVETHEVEEVLAGKPKFRFVEKGEREGEDVYVALGQTEAGRYLTVLFIHKTTKEALILSARDMAEKERKLYARK